MGIVIGIGGSLHDFSACLINDSNELTAIEDERIIRKRYALGNGTPHVQSVHYCLNSLGLDLSAVSKLVGDDMIDTKYFEKREFINHHLAHIYSSFFTSNFEESAILVLDGVGSLSPYGIEEERETATYGHGVGNKIKILGKIFGTPSNFRFSALTPRIRNNSLGEFYRLFTQLIGFEFLESGKTMGLFPYGDDRFINAIQKFVNLLPLGQYEIKVEQGLLSYLLSLVKQNNGILSFEIKASLAKAAQFALERVFKHCLDYLWSVTSSKNLCLAGGVILNSVANGKILELSKFKNVHIISAPGDNGAAIGSAIYGKLLEGTPLTPRRFNYSPYLGINYSNDEILAAILKKGIVYTKPEFVSEHIAIKISEGLTVACFQGRSEFGPRALGNRSIFADPRVAANKDKLNQIKNREWFRPVAPVVVQEELNTFFYATSSSSYMQYVFGVREEYFDDLPGSIHIDKSARVQTVNEEENAFLYSLLIEFANISGYPVLINTSFNTKGQPIVETPDEAIDCFIHSDIDALIIGVFYIEKR